MLVDYEFYTSNGYSKLDENNATQYLSKAERQINTICFNHLNRLDKYMEKTQNIVKIIICEHAEFLLDNNDNSNYGMLSSYSNGSASISFDNSQTNIIIKNGVGIKSDLYSELVQTGLCFRGI